MSTEYTISVDEHDENGEPGGLATTIGTVKAISVRAAVRVWNNENPDKRIDPDMVRIDGQHGEISYIDVTIYIEGD